MKSIIYDHKGMHGVLRKWAEEIAKSDPNIAVIREENQAKAVQELLKSESDLLLVHLEPKFWCNLIDNLEKQKCAFRFSTVGFSPTPPTGKHQNGFHVNPRTENEKGEPETPFFLPDLFSAIIGGDVLSTLRSGMVPPAIRHFISFHQPHFARALHILLQGWLAQWAGDIGHPNNAEAKKLLGLGNSIPPLNHEIDWLRMLRTLLSSSGVSVSDPTNDSVLIKRGLGSLRLEMGLKADFGESPIKEIGDLLQQALAQSNDRADLTNKAKCNAADAALFPALKKARTELSKTLRLQWEEGS